MSRLGEIMKLSPVVPVATIVREQDAVALAEALVAGGITIIEVTLRSQAALGAIAAIRSAVPQMCVGAGTLWTADHARAAAAAGAQFFVSPGIADAVYDEAVRLDVPYLPGAQTVSEVAHLVRRGASAVKFFPASAAGGTAALASFAAVFGDVTFCPTGGISEATAPDYLRLPSVACVGGSWLVSAPLLAARDWQTVAAMAARAMTLGRG